MAKKSTAPQKIKLLVATRNPGKFREFKHFLSGLDVTLVSLKDFPQFQETQEPYLTFEENARHKALSAFRKTGLMALADDSGLEVDALKGAPGVRSARFAGARASDYQNNRKLLKLLEAVPESGRLARFRCVIALVTDAKNVHTFSGEARGIILFEPRGRKGFGYDPLFYYPAL